mgnify:CR=1 FL=1
MKYPLLSLMFIITLGIFQTSQSQSLIFVHMNEYEKATNLKNQLNQVKNATQEKKLLREVWLLTRNNRTEKPSVKIKLYISIKDKNGRSININQRQQGHIAEITLRAYDNNRKRKIKWNLKITHQLLDMHNLSQLLYE